VKKYAEEKKEYDKQQVILKQKEEQTRILKAHQDDLAAQI